MQADQIGDLIGLVNSFDLPHGLRTSLDARLRAALAAVNAGATATTCGDLTAFGNEVGAQAGKKLAEAEAQQYCSLEDDAARRDSSGSQDRERVVA